MEVRAILPLCSREENDHLSEGWTPLVKFSGNAYFKLEISNPTGSFKDRGSTVLVSALHKLEKAGGYISEDSSGNAGASMAAYAARAGLRPESMFQKMFLDQSLIKSNFTARKSRRFRVAAAKLRRKPKNVEKENSMLGTYFIRFSETE